METTKKTHLQHPLQSAVNVEDRHENADNLCYQSINKKMDFNICI
jgi:hypothetical protein